MHESLIPGTTAPLLWDELPDSIVLAFADVRMPPRVAAAIVGYFEHQRIIRRRGDEVVILGLPASKDVTGTLRDMVEDQALQTYSGLGPWLAYFFQPYGSHGPGIDIGSFLGRTPSVAGAAVASNIRDIVAAYRVLLRNSPELAEFAYEIIGYIFSRYWALFCDVVRPLKPADRALLASDVVRWDQFPSPSSAHAEEFVNGREDGGASDGDSVIDRESAVEQARRRVNDGMLRDAVDTVGQLAFETRHARDIADEYRAAGSLDAGADEAADHAALAGIVAGHIDQSFVMPEGGPLEQLDYMHRWFERVLHDLEAGTARVVARDSRGGDTGPGVAETDSKAQSHETNQAVNMTFLESGAMVFEDLDSRRHTIPPEQLVEDIRREAQRIGKYIVEDASNHADGASMPWRMAARDKTVEKICRYQFRGESSPVDVPFSDLLTRLWREGNHDERHYRWSTSGRREWVCRHVFYEFVMAQLETEWEWPGKQFVVALGLGDVAFVWDTLYAVELVEIADHVVPGAQQPIVVVPDWVRDLPRWFALACKRAARELARQETRTNGRGRSAAAATLKSPSERQARSWLEEYGELTPGEVVPSDFDHSPDFLSVRWSGVDYSFKKTQAAVVKLLWHAWMRGVPRVSEATIGDEIGSAAVQFRLRDVFRSKKTGPHPAWRVMIVSDGPGVFRLADQNPSRTPV